MENIGLKKLHAEDALLLSEIALSAYSDHYLRLWHDRGKWYTKKCFSINSLAAELRDPNAVFYLVYHNNCRVGFLKLNINAPLEGEEESSCVELERIYLLQKATGIGIGRELINLTFGIAREQKKDIVWLKAMDSSTNSISFYKRMGFQITGRCRLGFSQMKEEFREMVIMKKRM